MDSSTLAQKFNEVSDLLQARGHRIIVRRVRSFLEAGDTTGAQTFLVRAKESLSPPDPTVASLAAELQDFSQAGGDVSLLVTDPAWVEGAAKENRLGRMVEAAAAGHGFGQLVDQLARQSRALAAGEPVAPVPLRQVEPSALPPLPRAGAVDDRAPLGNIFVPRRQRAVVEALADLEPKPMDLDEVETPALPGAPGKGQVELETPSLPPAAPAIPDIAEDTPRGRVSPEPLELPPVEEPVEHPRGRSGLHAVSPMDLPELHAPPEMPETPTAPAGGKKNGAGLLIGLVLAVAVVAALVWALT